MVRSAGIGWGKVGLGVDLPARRQAGLPKVEIGEGGAAPDHRWGQGSGIVEEGFGPGVSRHG